MSQNFHTFPQNSGYGRSYVSPTSRLALVWAAPVGEIGRKADHFDGRFLQRFQAGIDDRPGGAFEHFVGVGHFLLDHVGIGISLPGISAKRLEALFADIAKPHRVHSKTNDFSLLDLEERGRRLNVKDDRDISNEIAPYSEINRKRRFGSTRD